MNCFPFEIIPKREIPEHFEECMVVRGNTDIADIARSQAFLRSGGLGKIDRANPQELVFELVHPGGGKQHRRIVLGNQHVGRTSDAAFGFEEGKILFAKLVCFHFNSIRLP